MSTEIGFRIVRFGDVPWQPRTEDQWPCLAKRQVSDPARDLTIRTVWYARDAVEPRHVHRGSHAAVVLLGQALVNGQSLGPWDMVYGPGDVPHGPLHYPVGCMLFAMLKGSPLHRAVGQEATAADSNGLPAQVVLERDRPWSRPEDNADGWRCERKVLLHDQGRDYTAMLVRWAPGSVEPRHVQAGTHAALILSGRAVVEGVELGPWDLMYGPVGVPHGPIAFPEGCTLLVCLQGELYHQQVES